jgi:3'-5' exoribonuclease
MSLSPIQAREYLHEQIDKYIFNESFYPMCMGLIEDKAFNTAPASIGHHVEYHRLDGGLIVHTAEVLKHAIGMARTCHADIAILVVAAIFHDCMKVRDYQKDEDGQWKDAYYKNIIRHLCGSHAEFVAKCQIWNLSGPHVDHIEHCILAHHGRKEWGSPVDPQTKEAMILHFADMLSCNYGEGR